LELGKYSEKVKIINEKEETKDILSNIDKNVNTQNEKKTKDNINNICNIVENINKYILDLLKKEKYKKC
jgi:hypothetical protein